MKSKMKKLLGLLLGGAFAVFGLSGCGSGGGTQVEKTVMNVSLNPRVEFVLDANDKVVSVNALNEEGNLIINAEVFTGKSAEEAATLFVEVSKDTGFLVSGTALGGEQEISISFSGDTDKAKDLFDDVKGKVQEYLSTESITANIEQAAAITEEQLKALVAECAPYLDTAKMQYAELVDALEASRKETAELYSQELKNAYYEAKAFAMEQAKLEVLKSKLDSVSQLAITVANNLYTTTVQTIESTRNTLLVAENSPYQLALKTFREAKTDYLEFRKELAQKTELSADMQAQLDSLQSAVDTAENALVKAGTDANESLNTIKTQIKGYYDQIMQTINEQSIKASENAEAIATKQQEALNAFFTQFESDYASAKTAAKQNWDTMHSLLDPTPPQS